MGVAVIPPITGLNFSRFIAFSINSAAFLEDIYVNQNKFHTKHYKERELFSNFIPESILFQDSDHPSYSDKRKAVSGAFFKSKLISMTTIIKRVTLMEIDRL
jgi:hypothetical protein